MSRLKAFVNARTPATNNHGSNDKLYAIRNGTDELLMNLSVLKQKPIEDAIASAGTVNLTGLGGSVVPIDGTTTVTAFTVLEGDTVFVRVVDGFTATYHATNLPIPGHADVTFQPDDLIELYGMAGNIGEIVDVKRASGKALIPSVPRARVVTTGNITISTALNNGDSLNGVTLVTGDIVLVAFQSTASQNGLYTVAASPARTPFYDTWDSFVGLLVTTGSEGTFSPDTIWKCTVAPGGTIGSTSLTFISQVGTLGGQNKNQANITDGSATLEFLKVWDDDKSNTCRLKCEADLSGDRVLTFQIDDADRVLHILADATVSGTLTDTRPVTAKTADYTVLAGDTGKIFTNTGTAGDVTFTLPASGGCTAGKTRFSFYNLDATASYRNFIQVNGTDHLYFIAGGAPFDITGGNTTSDDRTIGGFMTVLYHGGGIWLVEAMSNNWS